ncbi:conserved hypothetical protein [Culex quinquefasciatus]|uniref:E3 ubiquitin-protein ligase KCMF1 n=1 Tax=Culex quinquefasciatus TaxID=7176 RepID=B0XK14_CULQU|nr:conserved hypothetical protein [Culex quinquefasciatus]|eukprot:XP_001869986.1 conserved hypothetical protein [Culex quinquefasciatus]
MQFAYENHLAKHREPSKVLNCSTCEKSAFPGNRYTCLLCPEYTQCEECYQAKRQNFQHVSYHPMQEILPKEKYATRTSSTVNIFRCPFCGDGGFSANGLTNHCHKLHEDTGKRSLLSTKILPKKAYAVQNPPPARIYRCPFCGEDDFSVGGLANHCFKLHVDCKMSSIRCPICVVCRLQIEDDSLPKGSFFDHLMMVHGLFPKADRQQEPEEPTECTVCKLELDGEAAAKKYYQCSHDCFHDRCIRFWLSSNPICPICHADAA